MTPVPLAHSDRAAVVALWREAGLTRPWNDADADFDRALVGPASTVLGISDGERLLATVMVGHDGHRGWFYYLAVALDARRAGHGRALIAAAERWLRVRGIPKAQLMVRADNADALGFYGRLGYEPSDVAVLSRWLEQTDPHS